jgi:hypothetical protein
LQVLTPIITNAQGPSEEIQTEIQTGTAVAGLEVLNEVNTTELSTNEEPVVLIENYEEAATESLLPDVPLETEIIASTTNLATTTTNATSTALTGENAASGYDTNIATGDAVAYIDLLNVVNTNIINSDGLITFINDTLGYNNFDLRPDFTVIYADFETAVSTSNCELDSCSDQQILFTGTNLADIENNVTVIADTGLNTANGENTYIETGDAYAAANIINVANTNIVDSQYLLLVFNNFDDYAGDIILPSSNFFDKFLTTNAITFGSVDLNNEARLENETQTVAHTGENIANGETVLVETGAAFAQSDITNAVNQSLIGGTTFSMLIRVHGDWTGTISGLPAGMTWRETERGIEIMNTTGNQGLPISTESSTITNSATIRNNVQVYALTGDNEATGNSTSIKTGNAYANSSIMNIANSNIIGSNWTNLIFNIYGNWNGNLTFGQPDLWIGVTASAPTTPIMPNTLVTYTFTVFNYGDTTAPDVILEGIFENDTLTFTEGERLPFTADFTKQRWSLGDIKNGETKEFTYVAKINEHINRKVVSAIPLTSRVTSSQKDANDTDNEEVVTVYVGKNRGGGNNNSQKTTFPANFEITKTASHDLAQPGDTVDYTITLFNRGGPLFDALLVDTLENEQGDIVQQHTWPLTEIKTWETITISYSMEFDSGMATGTYTNFAQLVGFHQSRREMYQKPYETIVAKHTLDLGIRPTGQVLGAQDTTCSPYLTTYLRHGANNDSDEVEKLQTFLNEQFNRQLIVSGHFDLMTEQAVRDFQIVHRDEILTPWGLERDSGYVYYTTQQKINELMCQGKKAFTLDAVQKAEIAEYRSTISNTNNAHTISLPSSEKSLPAPLITPPAVTLSNNKEHALRENSEKLFTEELPKIVTDKPTTIWGVMTRWWKSLTTSNVSFWQR